MHKLTINARRGLAFVDLIIAVITSVASFAPTSVLIYVINACSF